jgi:hypothetical protein
MAPKAFFDSIIFPALDLLPAKMKSQEAIMEMIAIAYQESNFQFRIQQPNGPAKGFWQFEEGGGVKGVMTHAASRGFAQSVAIVRGVKFESKAIYDALESDDVLAACFARLLLYTDRAGLPEIDDPINNGRPQDSDSWKYYYRNWRPGKPHPSKWPHSRLRAAEALMVM